MLLHAYRLGVFPMGDEDGSISWYSPDPRGIVELEQFHVPKNLAKLVRQQRFDIRLNADFAAVMCACADRADTWISQEIICAYQALHVSGFAHSVEAWQGTELVGGLYGVAIGGAFFGESMFHRVTDASKVALVELVQRLRNRGFTLLDTQWTTAHLRRFGARDISRDEYLQRLGAALQLDCRFD